MLIVLGGLWLCLWQTRTRALGLVIAGAWPCSCAAATRPDVLIDRDGETAALRSESGSLIFPPATAAGYSVDNWLLADGDSRDAATASSSDDAASPLDCDLLGCIGTVKGKIVALIRHPAALEEDCRMADIVIAPFTVEQEVSRRAGDRRPAHAEGRGRSRALYRGPVDPRPRRSAAERGHRPWVPEHVLVRGAPQLGRTSSEMTVRPINVGRHSGNPEE